MPIYEYQCEDCGHVSEYLMYQNDSHSVLCKSCGSGRVERVLSTSSVLSKMPHRAPGKTCCGRDERCATPPCSSGGGESSCCKR
nr:zinc ribbon domain-containing protein [Deltaproteobacteria bacterium]